MTTAQAAKILKALSHPNRLDIYLSIARGDACDFEDGCGCCVSDIMARLRIGAPTVSHHLKELVNAGLILTERQGKHLVARANPAVIEEVTRLLRTV
ncbi:metalloregulator ArsR/SmtB family transcription factor [Solidesulfovibrio sp.]|uniref:ArsR/SmtB family transcription factor n=1 Tax=Solidesulfovibrio sp. TaxID=2910990 RepID=UPI00261D4F94|nr:metalloregulator ArsR/SmtB family transcription factor [Solidesulfovibrio sp.]